MIELNHHFPIATHSWYAYAVMRGGGADVLHEGSQCTVMEPAVGFVASPVWSNDWWGKRPSRSSRTTTTLSASSTVGIWSFDPVRSWFFPCLEPSQDSLPAIIGYLVYFRWLVHVSSPSHLLAGANLLHHHLSRSPARARPKLSNLRHACQLPQLQWLGPGMVVKLPCHVVQTPYSPP